MAMKIQLRRGLKADLPTLDVGEVGITTDTNEMFVGSSSGNKQMTFDANKYASYDAQLADNTTKLTETVATMPMPEKYGIKTKSPKIVVVGANNDELKVIQYNGVKYIVYSLDKAPGDSSANSVGGAWDLIRIKKAILANNAYVAKKDYDPASVVGTINTLFAPAYRNVLEDYLIYSMSDEDTANFLSASGDGFGLSVYGIVGASAISSVSWNVKLGSGRKCSILVYGSATTSASADILVNGEVVKSFDSSKLALGSNLTFKIIEFEIPSRINLSAVPVVVTLRNNDISNKKLYFSCLNFMPLKDYDGRDVDFYKVFTTSLKWIDHAGASDYAIFDHDLQKWCGSYHGGETRISARMTYASGSEWSPPTDWDTGRTALRNKSDVPVGWYVMPTFKIQQLTDINGKGKMLSILDFDVDGTLQMDFSFYDGNINVETFYTALTNSHIDLNYIRYPKYEALPSPPTNVYLQGKEGYLIQLNSAKGISLGIRHTMFGGRYIPNELKKSGYIYNHATYYKKHYYGLIQEYNEGVMVESLQFRKALDFMAE